MYCRRLHSVFTCEAPFKRVGAHSIKLFEPIYINAPSTAKPYCCYLSTVILHKDGSRREEYGRVDTHFLLGVSPTVLLVAGLAGAWEVTGATVRWTRGQWHKVWSARDNTKAAGMVLAGLKAEQHESLGWRRLEECKRAMDQAILNLQTLTNLTDQETSLHIINQTANLLANAIHGGSQTTHGNGPGH